MGSMSIWHWVIVGILVILLFGRGRISDMMGDVAKGIKSFRKGLADDDTPAPPAPQVTADRAVQPAPTQTPDGAPR
jgi:sec-independent protein translocase protein TatA